MRMLKLKIQPLMTMALVLSITCISCGVGTTKTKRGTLYPDPGPETALNVLNRVIGKEKLENFTFILRPRRDGNDGFQIHKEGKKIVIEAASPTALCYGTYYYLKTACRCMVTWSGKNIRIPETLPPLEVEIVSPYRYRYYFNVVTHGYSTAYWDWPRWEQEIDWMALHGINMPLVPGAHEAILYRVFQHIGLEKQDIESYFSGPAHFPWNRMGNLANWDGPPPDSYYKKQLALTHKILRRMRALGMEPVVHAFAGFVPGALKKHFPQEDIRRLGWAGGVPEKYNAFILAPGSPLFTRIGKLYIREWEKEFGKGKFFLADSFNEMDVPLDKAPEKAMEELAGYGENVFRSINGVNPDAVWVMQGWTFPFHRDRQGKLFWTPERLRALVSRVPDHKLMILDLANEYNHHVWKIPPSWKTYDGFFNKQWVYSFIPNMGGKVALNGRARVYASLPIEALNDPKKGNLVGFGFAPEGIENNEMIYELLADMGWRTSPLDFPAWVEGYCLQRYGAFPEGMRRAFELLSQSCYGSFTDHPVSRYQLRPYRRPRGVKDKATVHRSGEFTEAVAAFLDCAGQFKNNRFYLYDAVDLTVQYLGLVADRKLYDFLRRGKRADWPVLEEAMEILLTMDRLLASHPDRSLKKWLDYARGWGDTIEEKNYYESNARRLLTTWGGEPVNDYSCRVWSGLISHYYVRRWQEFYKAKRNSAPFDLNRWEEHWITTPGFPAEKPYENPLSAVLESFSKYK